MTKIRIVFIEVSDEFAKSKQENDCLKTKMRGLKMKMYREQRRKMIKTVREIRYWSEILTMQL